MKWVYLLLMIFICGASASAEEIRLLPSQFTLSGPEARQTLLAEQSRDNIFVGQLKENVTLTSSDTEILRIKNGVAIPVGNGKVTITARAEGGHYTFIEVITDQVGESEIFLEVDQQIENLRLDG